MIQDQRTFYRELDNFLSQIDQNQKRKDFLNSVLQQLVSRFGRDLKIAGGSIYVERIDGFVPALNDSRGSQPDLDPIAVEQIFIHKTYIFDQPEIPLFTGVPAGSNGTIPAAFIVGERERRWIIVVNLEPGWEREEIEFVLNITRSMLNHTVFFSSVTSEMDQAALIQATLIPERVPVLSGFSFAAKLIPAEPVGGDLYDFLTPDDNAIGLALGDATGHGIPASLLARDVVTGLRMGIEKEMKMQPLIAKLNRVIHANNLSTNFISLFYGELENNGSLFYVNAGHMPPLHLSRNTFSELRTGGLVLGPIQDAKFYRGFVQMEPGDILVMYTDGLVERMDEDDEEFGEERLKQAILDNRKKPADQMLESIVRASFRFGSEPAWADDVTVLVIIRNRGSKK
jgi:sigma-B regulation protein RsbU (phosphoserine phosphatase)